MRTATGSELFSLLTCLHTTTFTLPSIFSPLEMINIKMWETLLSCHAKCSLPVVVRASKTSVLNLPNMISRQKNAGYQMQRFHAISRQGKLPEHSRCQRLSFLSTSTPTVYTGGRRTDVRDVITKISLMDRFPKKSYPWCSAGALRAPELRYDAGRLLLQFI